MYGFLIALIYILQNEGGYQNHVQDLGKATKYGISQKLMESMYAHGFRWVDLNNDGKIDEKDVKIADIKNAIDIYYEIFWKELRLDLVKNEAIAIKIFDTAINIGGKNAIKLLQKSINSLNNKGLIVDGIIGTLTLNALEKCKTEELLNAFSKNLVSYYENIVRNNPSQSVFLQGWINRATRAPKY
jgi:lysozyme family protein